MPQMSPLNWCLISLYSLMPMALVIFYLYSITFPQVKLTISGPMKPNFLLKW